MSSNLPPYVQALLKPDTYPEHPARIELMQRRIQVRVAVDEIVFHAPLLRRCARRLTR